MENLNFINGATVSATDVRKSWTKIVKGVKESKRPAFVFTNNVPEAVVLDFESYQEMAEEVENAKRKLLQEELETTYVDFIRKYNIKPQDLHVAETGVEYEVKGED